MIVKGMAKTLIAMLESSLFPQVISATWLNYRYFDYINGNSYRGWYYQKSKSFQKLQNVLKISIVNVDQKRLNTTVYVTKIKILKWQKWSVSRPTSLFEWFSCLIFQVSALRNSFF